MAFGSHDWRALSRRYAPWLLLVVFSLTLHLWRLGERSYHHDESIHAHAAYVLLQNGTYRYDPTYHGPLLYYLTAAGFAIIGDSDFTARLPIALAGVALIAIAWALRRPLGVRAAWWTGLLATISPIYLYYGRFLRMDILEALVASAAMIAVWRAGRGSSKAWIWFGVWTALAFATKENAFVTAALSGVVLAIMLLSNGWRRAVPVAVEWIKRHRWGLVAAVGAAVVVSVPLFTVGFRHPGDWFFPYKAISYWWGQHSIQRVAGPPWYHLPRLAIYEFLPIVAALVWAWHRRRRMNTVERSLLLFAVASVAMYCYLGEKVPWLGVHQVWAFLPLAGLQLARTFSRQGVWWSRLLAGAGLAATLATTLIANFVLDEISPNQERVEALIYVQTAPEVVAPVKDGYRLAEEGEDPVGAVGGEVAWPYSWYWRSTPTWWADPPPGMRPPIVFCDVDKEREIRTRLGPGYSSERVPLRAWWVMADRKPTIAEVVRYVFTRRPWGGIGSTDTILMRYTGDTSDGGPREAEVPEALGEALGVVSATVIGESWLIEPRGLAVAADGALAVADVNLGDVAFFDPDGGLSELRIPEDLNQPEAAAWTPNGALVVADTWNHRVLVFDPGSGASRILPEPEEGWYGPRAVAVAADGTIAVSDTGRKRIVLIGFKGGAPQIEIIGGEGSGPGELLEPVGVVWLDRNRLLVCDTANRRLQIFARSGAFVEEIALPEAWSDFYSRPQVVALDARRWLVTDVPARSLWLIDDGVAQKIDLTDAGIVPTGLALRGNTLFVADQNARVWVLVLAQEP